MIERLIEEIKSGKVKIVLFNENERPSLVKRGGWVVVHVISSKVENVRNWYLLKMELGYLKAAILRKLKVEMHSLALELELYVRNLDIFTDISFSSIENGKDIERQVIDSERGRIASLFDALAPEGFEDRFDSVQAAWGFFPKEVKL